MKYLKKKSLKPIKIHNFFYSEVPVSYMSWYLLLSEKVEKVCALL